MTCPGCLPAPVRSLHAQHVSFAITAADTVALCALTFWPKPISHCHPLALGTE